MRGRVFHASATKRLILSRLIKSMPNTVTRESLAVAIWGDSAYDKEWKSVDVLLCAIRKILAGSGFRIYGEHGVGWRLVEEK
ncbi:MAG: helix-turn-helix domain-containing protein [Alphaproteobacteria bacterium]|nr:helix-turn-helix domain-containing protein [Alphaproteobacteria bacterium]